MDLKELFMDVYMNTQMSSSTDTGYIKSSKNDMFGWVHSFVVNVI